jgi:hypothetical protein
MKLDPRHSMRVLDACLLPMKPAVRQERSFGDNYKASSVLPIAIIFDDCCPLTYTAAANQHAGDCTRDDAFAPGISFPWW